MAQFSPFAANVRSVLCPESNRARGTQAGVAKPCDSGCGYLVDNYNKNQSLKGYFWCPVERFANCSVSRTWFEVSQKNLICFQGLLVGVANLVAGIARPPRADASDVPRVAEVALVRGFAEPASLAGGLAGSSAAGSRAVALVTAVTRVRAKELQAALALAAVSPGPCVPSCRGDIFGLSGGASYSMGPIDRPVVLDLNAFNPSDPPCADCRRYDR